jgi:predicted N-formylglutamate amidohydrolase
MPAAYEVCHADAASQLLFLCDHASNAVPPELGDLGLPRDAFARHIASDIGAAALTRALALRFAAPAILGRWSRLVVDLNRGADDPTAITKLSDGSIVPGNHALTPQQVAERMARYHAPYHDAIADHIAGALARGTIPVIISMHSFTPVWRGKPRPWHVGVLWDRDGRLARPLMARLMQEPGWVIGNNQPYSGELENDCLFRHGTMNGLPHVLIEIRQDLVSDAAGVAQVGDRLEAVLRDSLAAMGEPRIEFTRPLRAVSEWRGGTLMDEKTRTELEAAAFRRLVAHLRSRTDVQNIDMMNLAGFCRNCLGDWYREAAAEKGITLDKDQAREIVYGMPPAEWKKRYQKEASPDAQAQFAKSQKTHS